MSTALIGATVIAGLLLAVSVALLVLGVEGMINGTALRCPACGQARIIADGRHARCWRCRHAHASHVVHLGALSLRHGG